MITSMNEKWPDILSYVSAIEYLNDLYRFQKKQNAGFSFESWSMDLGYNSRSFMKMLCSGQRRITQSFVDNFSAKMSLSPLEKEYLEALIAYGDASSSREKAAYLDQIFEIRGRAKRLALIEADSFVLNPQLPALQTLLTFKDVPKNSLELSDLMNITPGEVESLLQKLSALGLAKQNTITNTWDATNGSFTVPTKQGSAALEAYHNFSASESIRAQQLPVDSRRFRSLLLPLNPAQFQDFCAEMEIVITRLLAKYDTDELGDGQLYKINLNAYPVSKKRASTLKIENTTSLVDKPALMRL